MLQAFSAYIQNVAVFLIFASLVMILAPNERYRSYIRLTLGFLLVLLAVKPLGGVLNALGGNGLQDALAQLSMDYSRSDLAVRHGLAPDAQDSLVLEAYERELYVHLEAIVLRRGLHLETAAFTLANEGERFGMVEEIYITVSEPTAASASKPLIRIEPIRIQSGVLAEAETDDAPPAVEELKKNISDFYNLSTQHIYCIMRPNKAQ